MLSYPLNNFSEDRAAFTTMFMPALTATVIVLTESIGEWSIRVIQKR